MKPIQIVNLAIGRLIKQGNYGATKGVGVNCSYRTQGGKCCVVGILLDRATQAHFVNNDFGPISEIPSGEFPSELRPHLNLLEKMQGIHDCAVAHYTPFHKFIMTLSEILEVQHDPYP